MNFLDEIFNYFVPPVRPLETHHIKPYFETKIIKAKNIDTGEDVWLEMPMSQVDLRRLKDTRVHGGDSL